MKTYPAPIQTMRPARRTIFIITLVLIAMGIVMIYSSSAIYAYDRHGESLYFFKRHLLFLIIGSIFMFYVMSMDLSSIDKVSKILLALSLFFLVLVLIPGIGASIGGARRWFKVGPLSFQPSELAKFTLICYLASFINRKGAKAKDLLHGFLPCIFVISLMCVLVLLQPDLGTAVSIFFIGFLIIFIAGGRLKHLVSTAILGLPFLLYMVLSVPYRRKRMLIFLNPWRDKKASGFQIIQSFLALGSGGLFGVGLGQSKQKLFYLPESHTDFIFSIIGEELGFLGTAAIVILFGIFVFLGSQAFLKEERPLNKIIIFGVTSLIGFEALVNMGVSVGAIPTKGLPLPFISYGGSSLVFHMAAVGLLLNAMRQR